MMVPGCQRSLVLLGDPFSPLGEVSLRLGPESFPGGPLPVCAPIRPAW